MSGHVRDLSVFDHLVYLKVPRRQFYCPNCQTSPTEPLSWLNKKQRQTNRYQEYIYEKVREGVEEVCVDMWGGFPKVIREVFPNAKIVVDRFHVQKLLNQALNKIRLHSS